MKSHKIVQSSEILEDGIVTYKRNVLIFTFLSFYMKGCHFLLEISIFISCMKAEEQ